MTRSGDVGTHHSLAGFQVLRVLYEAEVDGGLVAGPQVVLRHPHDGGCLTHTAHVHCDKKQTESGA